jgi:hypothetical protein
VAALKIPPILLEDDEPARPLAKEQVVKPAPVAPPAQDPGSAPERTKLPEAYGTGQLLLVARDPLTLYAHWDLTPEQQKLHQAEAAGHGLVLRVHDRQHPADKPAAELQVKAEAHHQFVPVERGGAIYEADIGYYGADREWTTIATSAPAATPRNMPSEDKAARFVALGSKGLEAASNLPEGAAPEWTPSQERELAAMTAAHEPAAGGMDSLEISKAVGELGSISSPIGGGTAEPRGFRLDLNVELVVYGSTEPNATVTVAGRLMQLRPDGSFSCRFSLPDGDYELPVAAFSAEGEMRSARLRFQRRSECEGQVGVAHALETLEAPPRACQ